MPPGVGGGRAARGRAAGARCLPARRVGQLWRRCEAGEAIAAPGAGAARRGGGRWGECLPAVRPALVEELRAAVRWESVSWEQ